jgi:hypothetical protein
VELAQTQSKSSDWIYESESEFLFELKAFLKAKLAFEPTLQLLVAAVGLL